MRAKNKLFLKALSVLCALLMLTGLFAGCVALDCKHEYANGVCTLCGDECEHAEYADGKCKVCGAACEHKKYEFGVCTDCKAVCAHEVYEGGKCKECGTACTHEKYVNSKCEACGTACLHNEYSAGVCTVCGYECKHEKYANGKCKVCGSSCKHNYVNNVCVNCGAEKFVDPTKPEAHYDYAPHLSAELPCIYVQSDTFLSDATRYVPSFDNYNPGGNIDWQYHNCTVTVNNCEDAYALSDIAAGIKVRGNWTTTYDKKPFRIKFDKKQGMLGLNDGAKCKSWVLLADYKDCALERNSLAYYLGQQILGSDGYYCTDYRQVKLYLNNQYWGVYLLAEQQQVNSNRIAITEPDDLGEKYQGTDIGYFIEFDGYYNLELYAERFSCNYNYSNQNANGSSRLRTRDGWDVYPDQFGFAIKSDVYYDDEYNCAQKQFIKNYTWMLYKLCYEAVFNRKYYTFNDTYTALVNYTPTSSNAVQETVSKVIDIQSLVDTYILNEIVCDYDINWSSFLMDVDFGPNAKDHLLRFEAPWDFDSAFALRDRVESGTGLYAANSNNPWMLIFINQSWFWNKVKAKWQEMNSANVQQDALQYVKTLRTKYSAAYEENFKRWGFVVSGEAVWDLQNNRTHQYWSDYLYNWLNTRFTYLDSIWL